MPLRSGPERSLDLQLRASGLVYSNEAIKLPYILSYNYIPDFYIPSLDMYIEVKGYFRRDDQAKMKAIKQQHPELDIRFVFQEADKKIAYGKITNAQWAEKNNFPWAEGRIPDEWFLK